MPEQRKLALLTTSIYDAALDQALWPEVLAAVADFVGGQVGGLLVKDNVRRNVCAHFHAGIDDYHLQLYADTYYQFGPIANSACGDVEQILTVPDLVPYDEFRRGRFYQEWAEPQGWVDAAMVALTRTSSCCAYLSIARHEASGMVDTEMLRRMGLIVPHMRLPFSPPDLNLCHAYLRGCTLRSRTDLGLVSIRADVFFSCSQPLQANTRGLFAKSFQLEFPLSGSPTS